MERLLADAQKISGVKYDISNFNDIIEAIHVIQTEMGITGTTAKEAASTIEGSLNMTKSAWTNLLTGMADDNSNFDVLVQNLVNSLGSLAENLLPRVKIAIEGIGELLRTLLPKVLDEIPEIMASLFPESMQEDIKIIFEGIVEAIKTTVNFAIQWIPKITEGFAWFLENSSTIVGGILAISAAIAGFKVGAMITKVIKSWQEAQLALALYGMSAEGVTIKQGVMNGVFTAWETLVALFTGKISLATVATTLWSKAQSVLNAVITANPIGILIAGITALVVGIVYLWNTNEGFRNAIIKAWNAIKEAGIDAWNRLLKFFTEDIPKAWDSVVTFFKGIPDCFKEIWSKITDTCKEWGNNISNFFVELWNGILDIIKQWGYNIKNFFTETVPTIIQNVITWFEELPYKIGYILGALLGTVIKGWVNIFNYFAENIPLWIEKISNWFSELPGKIWTWLVESYNKISQWGTDTWNKAIEIGTNFLNSIIQFFSQLPGKIWTYLINTYNKVVSWGSNIYSKASEVGSNFINNIINWFKQLPGQISTWLSNTIAKVSEFATNLGNKALEAGKNMVNNIIDAVKNLPSQMASIGSSIVEGVWNGITSMGSWIADKVSGFFGGIVDGAKKALKINSPSKVFRDQVGKSIPEGVADGIEKGMPEVDRQIDINSREMVNRMKATVNFEHSRAIPTSVSNINTRNISSVTNNNDNGVTQNININQPVKSPSEIAREIRKVGRELAFV
ncbi:phage tail protein [Clostridium celatum]|nr:hypothetical protein [Clostridium celatum]